MSARSPVNPATPTNNLRNRHSPQATERDTSPPLQATSPTASSTSQASFDPTRSGYRSIFQNLPSTLNESGHVINLNTPPRKFIIRSDPSLVSCFDPADKELYDLWAPRR